MTVETDSCGHGLRNRFFSRKRMLAADFALEQAYAIGRRRLVNAAVLGWGVVYGFPIQGPKHRPQADAPVDARENAPASISLEAVPLIVGAGLAFDQSGREVVLEDPVQLSAENTVLLVWSEGGWQARSLDGLDAGDYVLAAHYAERKVGSTVQPEWCGCGKPERTHLCETVVFSLRRDKCRCGDTDCPRCDPCVTDDCTSDHLGSHARLVAWATQRAAHPETGLTCKILEGHDIASDRVDLACVSIVRKPEHCRPIEITRVDASTPRRIVKTNDSLFDLIRGCGLTRIAEISWQKLVDDRSTSVTDFLAWFTGGRKPQTEPPTDFECGFRIRFTDPVKTATMSPSAIAISVFERDKRSRWLAPSRAPITKVSPVDAKGDLATEFIVMVDPEWVEDEMDDEASFLAFDDVLMEIEIRGDLIEDCSGQTVDANTHGTRIVPSGNGTPGGTHLTSFSIVKSSSSTAR